MADSTTPTVFTMPSRGQFASVPYNQTYGGQPEPVSRPLRGQILDTMRMSQLLPGYPKNPMSFAPDAKAGTSSARLTVPDAIPSAVVVGRSTVTTDYWAVGSPQDRDSLPESVVLPVLTARSLLAAQVYSRCSHWRARCSGYAGRTAGWGRLCRLLKVDCSILTAAGRTAEHWRIRGYIDGGIWRTDNLRPPLVLCKDFLAQRRQFPEELPGRAGVATTSAAINRR